MDPSQRVIEYIRDTANIVQTPDGPVTAAQMLEQFLFTPELQWSTIGKLSGGERKRLYLLKILMSALDIATLTILEDYLLHFQGAVIAVSHDRYFLDKIAAEIFVFRDGICERYTGNYSDYAEKCAPAAAAEKPKAASEKKERVFHGTVKLRFSYREQREYDTIEDDIAALEQQLAETEAQIVQSSSDYVLLQELTAKQEQLTQTLAEKMDRWVYLSDLAERIANGE